MNESVNTLKKSLRREMIRQRAELKPELIRNTSAVIVPRILDFIRKTFPDKKNYTLTVMSYMSHAGEFPTRELNQAILDHGCRLVLPYTNRDFQIEACVTDSLNNLRKSSMGIEEPDPSVCLHINASEADLILLPGIAFDRSGMRLGYGKGCYDRFLSQAEGRLPVTAALAWSFQILEQIPSEAHDKSCNFIITEKEMIPVQNRFSSAAL